MAHFIIYKTVLVVAYKAASKYMLISCGIMWGGAAQCICIVNTCHAVMCHAAGDSQYLRLGASRQPQSTNCCSAPKHVPILNQVLVTGGVQH